MKREEIKKPDYTAGIRHTTVGSDRHDVRRENFRNKTVRTAKRRSGLIGRLFACSATLALALGACTDDAPVEQPKSGGVDLTCIVESDLTAALGSSTDDRHSWESGDRIGVYAVSSAPTLNAEASVTTNDGTSSIAFHVNRAETGDKLHAYFPYTKDNSSNDAKNVALSIAAVQSQSEAGAFDIANLPMVSYPQRLDAESLSEIPALQMHVLGGILRAKVFADGQYGDEKVQSIAFADENTPMAGAFKLDLTGLSDEASLIVTGLASRTAKTQLSIPYAVPSSQESAKDIYMILAPGTYDGTLSVTTEKAVYTQPFQCEMKRNACYDASINLSTAARESIDGWNGEGTAEAPYQVATAEDLQRLIALCNSDGGEYAEFADKHYLQIADIDMAQIAIQPIGLSEQSPFRGVYDGGGHTIGNFTLTNCESGACGLFGYLDGATVKDIHLEECEYSASGLHAGGVAGVAKQSVIRGCTFEGSLVGTAETEFDGYAVSDVGGIIGYALDSEIAGCTLKGSIRALAQIGGMAGYTSGTKISDCTVDAAATIDAETHFLGGIVGRARHNSTIENCTVGGKASAYNGNYVGGIAGHLTSGKISGCTIAASASLSSKGDHTGGIVGALQANEENADDGSNMTAVVEDCETDIMVFGADNVGGIAGYQGTATAEHTSIVRNCTSRESVTGYGYNTGGISGSITSYGDSFIENCQAYGGLTCKVPCLSYPKIL
nr:GLUG motif-containing protein [uncultured Alistipes sp.]